MTWLLPLLWAGCEPADPLSEAWNQVFTIDSYAIGEGCDLPTATTEPPTPFLAIGLGGLEDLYLASSYLCPTASSCPNPPFSNAVLDTVELDHIRGFFGENAFDSSRTCLVSWLGLEATRTSNGGLTLVAQSYSGESFQATTADCDAYLDSLYGEACTQTLVIEATEVVD